eukprot:c18739_g1_i1.p1 GENE.c18739_g1_i1~~c18739_g1_i1.p1  ORF type:complete len:112 (-),score=21.63 c18739_g1_i1:738-1073(-)
MSTEMSCCSFFSRAPGHCAKHNISLGGNDKAKRLSFAKTRQQEDFKSWCWYDDKSFQIPPPPPNQHNAPQYRFPGSKKPIKTYTRSKSTTSLQMGVAVTFTGKMQPLFNVK